MNDTIKGILWGAFIILIIAFYPNQGGSADDYFDKKEAYEQEYQEDMEREVLARQEEIDSEASLAKSLYYIDNGYYYHDDINCKGLEGYTEDEINEFYPDDLINHQELKPCTWCNNNSVNNDSTDYTNPDINHKNEAIKDSIRESGEAEIEKRQEERRIREGESMTTREKLESKIQQSDNLKENEVLFLLEGYYYHNDPNCEGLKDCYNIKKGDKSKVINELALKPCNWCAK